MIEIAKRNPRKYYGLPFSTWSDEKGPIAAKTYGGIS